MTQIPYPNIPEGRPEDQIRQIKSYLYQLTDKLNYALQQLEKQQGTNKEG